MKNDIKFIKGEGMLGRSLASKDHYCGLLFYGVVPAGFVDNKIQKIGSIREAEELKITDDGSTEMQVLHYHLKCFFDVYKSRGVRPDFWLMCVETDDENYTELEELVNFTNGDLRKVGVYTTKDLAGTKVSKIDGICKNLEGVHKPISVVLSANISDTASAPELGTLDSRCVHVTAGQDGSGKGADLYKVLEKTVGNVGSLLAWSSVKLVHENIGWVAKFNAAFNGEFDVPALADGKLVSENETVADGLDTKRYIILRKHIGIGGTYFNDSHAATTETSDYAYMENSDVINKAIRGIRSYLLPMLSSPLYIDADNGQLSVETVAIFENEAYRAINDMLIGGELSGGKVTVDSDQDVLATSKLVVNVQLVINGVARNIEVNIGFTKKLN